MTPRPLIKWKSFWLGILVLGFLGWGWARSMGEVRSITYKRSPSSLAYVVYNGRSGVTVFSSDNESFARMKGVSTRGVPIDDDVVTLRSWFPPAVKTNLVVEGEHWRVRVAHWFLILLFLIPWCAWLFWHWKREQKKIP